MSRILGKEVLNVSSMIEDNRDTLKEKPLTTFNLSANGIAVPSAQNLLAVDGRLKTFTCDIIVDGAASVNAVRTIFYDTSGVPTGSEPVLFSIISFAQKIAGVTQGFSQHNYHFAERGIPFQHGIGIACSSLLGGSPNVAFVDANFGYVAPDDDYPEP